MTEDTRDEDARRREAPGENDERDALDRAISAAMDDALSIEAHEALIERIGAEPEVAARVRAFHAIDAGIRRLADDDAAASESEARHAAGLADLQARIEGASRTRWLRRAAPVVAAAAVAAALVLFVQTSGQRGEEATADIAGAGDPGIEVVLDETLDETLEETLEEELSVALGYGDEIDILPDVRVEDFEVVDQLELLEFLAEQEWEGQG